ncbi:MAG: hydroxymethylglutaryl-CoA synthase [Myxococcota bacterium]
MSTVGIDDIAIYFPRLFFDMKDFAQLRGANFGKLNRGLGLAAMAIPDVHEDTATMGANAVRRLIDRNDLDPRKIGRIYLGTESALDGSKPTATYIMGMLQQHYADRFGADCFQNCDVVDMTFACIGAVDAMHNTLDWIARGGEDDDRIGLVVFADNAKYDLGSTGEYTQGAGGGAILLRYNPRLMVIPDRWGVSTIPVHDFFKPLRQVKARQLVAEILQTVGHDDPALVDQALARLTEGQDAPLLDDTVKIHKDTPVFDGQYSNRCYSESVKQAFIHYRKQALADGSYNPDQDDVLTEQWKRIILHLPYAFQGKRMFPDVFKYDRQDKPEWADIVDQIGPEPDPVEFPDEALRTRAEDQYRRMISKTPQFKAFVEERIERGQRASSQIGNQYTGSIFLALMSTFESDHLEDNDITGVSFGLCGYGSGAKAKVFEGIVQPRWREVAARFELFKRLEARTPIDKDAYEALHRGTLTDSVVKPDNEFALVSVGRDGDLEGQRRYAWIG